MEPTWLFNNYKYCFTVDIFILWDNLYLKYQNNNNNFDNKVLFAWWKVKKKSLKTGAWTLYHLWSLLIFCSDLPSPSPVSERCSWCGCRARDHSDSFRWRSLLIVYLSAKAFHHFWCLWASHFKKSLRSYASQSSPSYFMLLRIINIRTDFDLGY